MMPTPFYYLGTSTDPYANLAREQVLARAVRPGECLMYLWRNDHTIVIGRNQNAWKECRVADFETDGGRLARRLSGGGAVYHDKGNVNFTFAAREDDYDVERHLHVICEAIRSFGLAAAVSGRNDVVIDGAKFSGNAFFRSGDMRCHHGTLMINVNMEALSHYLVPDKKKLQAKGIDSVRSRVVNLAALDERINVETLSKALIDALSKVYGQQALPLPLTRIHEDEIEQARQHFASWEWNFGEAVPFTHSFEERYPWGALDIELAIEDGLIQQAHISSDALDADFIEQLAAALPGCRYERTALRERLEALPTTSSEQEQLVLDCLSCIEEGF